jgi:hypothetical protein
MGEGKAGIRGNGTIERRDRAPGYMVSFASQPAT